jgi:NAD(P)-dependent dehydrogenase (short-subunit alcohol dehydrogenase family)
VRKTRNSVTLTRMGKLDSQVAIGIGSSRGIGRAVALELAREGANVALNGAHNRALLKRLEREIASSGREALALLADVAQRTEVDEMVHSSLGAVREASRATAERAATRAPEGDVA